VGVVQFFGEVVGELKKVTWPTRQETMRLTMIVIAISVAIGAVLGTLDIVFSQLLSFFF
ncbi:MAG: preprotein translocase subunit SecE, partial [Chloroflexi bacterium]|nr:preprotein translocase subunit SecE [Chloroflexota bacterium]